MKSTEDIIKEKLDAFEEVLPDGSLSDFRNRLDTSRACTASNTHRFAWYYLAIPVFAACLAGLFFIKPQPEISLQENSLPSETAQENNVAPSPVASVPALAQVQSFILKTPEIKESGRNNIDGVENSDTCQQTVDTTVVVITDSGDTKTATAQAALPHNTCGPNVLQTKKIPATLAAGGVLGGTLVGGLISSGKSSIESYPSHNYSFRNITFPDISEENSGLKSNYSLPFKISASLRWKLKNNLSLTSGLEYSLYSSSFSSSASEKHKQQAHYIGIPIRIDYSFARTKRLDVYMGAGGVADYCLAAKEDSAPIKKDGFSFSLQGVAGVQMNITERTGIYIEPQMTWIIPSSTTVLNTYRTEHPFNFSIATGIRLTLNQ